MGLGPGKGCMVRLRPTKETTMDGTPLQARQPLPPEIAAPGRRAPARRPAGSAIFTSRRRSSRPIWHGFFTAIGCSPAMPSRSPGRATSSPTGRQRIDHRGARPARRDPRLPQCLPPSRLAHLQDRARQRPPPGLPLSPLDLRARRLAGARHAPRVRRRQVGAVAAAGVDRRRRRPAVRLLRRRRRPISPTRCHHPPQDEAARASSAPRSRTRSTTW